MGEFAMKHSFKLALASISVLALAACGSGSPSGGADSSADAQGSLEQITVGVIPIVETAPIWLGEAKGFFAEEGLDLEIETATGGSAIVPGIQSGILSRIVSQADSASAAAAASSHVVVLFIF